VRARIDDIREHTTGAEEDVILYVHTFVDRDVVLDLYAIPDRHVAVDIHVLSQNAALSNACPSLDVAEEPDLGASTDRDILVNPRRLMHKVVAHPASEDSYLTLR
jgi:hypothetical protein